MPHSHNSHLPTATLLIVASEDVSYDGLLLQMLDREKVFNIHIITTCTLPLDEVHASVDHICFIVDLTSKESFQCMQNALPHVNVGFFLGKASIICINGEKTQQTFVYATDINALVSKYNLIPLYVNINDEDSCRHVITRLENLLMASTGLLKGLNPALIGAKSLCDKSPNETFG